MNKNNCIQKMYKILILMFGLILLRFSSYSKPRDEIYTAKVEKSLCSTELRIDKNGTYNLIVGFDSHIPINMLPLSLGRYEFKNDTLFFFDINNRKNFIAVKKKNEIAFISGYKYLIGTKLKLNNKKKKYTILPKKAFISQDTACYVKQDSIFSHGFYNGDFVSYEFKENGSFKAYCVFCDFGYKFIISEGTFILKGCILYLKDENYAESYRLLIRYNKLESIDVPYEPTGPFIKS